MAEVPIAMRRRLGMVVGLSEDDVQSFSLKPDWNLNYQSAWFKVQKLVQSPVLYDSSGMRTQVPEIEPPQTEQDTCVHDERDADLWIDPLDSIKHLPSGTAANSPSQQGKEIMDHDSFILACNLLHSKGQSKLKSCSSVVKHLSPTNVTDGPFFFDSEALKPVNILSETFKADASTSKTDARKSRDNRKLGSKRPAPSSSPSPGKTAEEEAMSPPNRKMTKNLSCFFSPGQLAASRLLDLRNA